MTENIRADEVVAGDRVQVGTSWQAVESVRHNRRRDDTVYVQVDWVGGGGATWPDDMTVTVDRKEASRTQDTDDADPTNAFARGDTVVVIDSSSPYYNQAGVVKSVAPKSGPGQKWCWYNLGGLAGQTEENLASFRYYQLAKTSRK